MPFSDNAKLRDQILAAEQVGLYTPLTPKNRAWCTMQRPEIWPYFDNIKVKKKKKKKFYQNYKNQHKKTRKCTSLPFVIFLRALRGQRKSDNSQYFKNTKKPVYSYSTNADRRFSSSTSQHFKMFPPFTSSEGHSASGVRYQSDGV